MSGLARTAIHRLDQEPEAALDVELDVPEVVLEPDDDELELELEPEPEPEPEDDLSEPLDEEEESFFLASDVDPPEEPLSAPERESVR